ncbi:MAG: hypothetical protein ABI247_12340 [Rhodanobacter sp.]
MEITFKGGALSVRHVLSDLGFQENWDVQWTDELPGYFFHFGNLKLTAVQVTNEYLQPEFQFGGVTSDSRSVTGIEFRMPLMIESLEQGTAWIVDALDRHQFKPFRAPVWMKTGREWRDHLPWVRRMKAYAARPQCCVDRDWLRVVARKLKEIAEGCDEESPATLSFDGVILKIRVYEREVVVAANGAPWPAEYTTKLAHLAVSMKRLMNVQIVLAVWEDSLHVGHRCMPLVIASGDDLASFIDPAG